MNVIIPSKRRNEVITIRSTSHEKEIINHKASLCGKTVSTYVMDAAMAGRETHRDQDKRMVKDLIGLTQGLDDCYRYLHCGSVDMEVLEEMFIKIMEGAGKLWGNL